jgi:hypothetical protein
VEWFVRCFDASANSSIAVALKSCGGNIEAAAVLSSCKRRELRPNLEEERGNFDSFFGDSDLSMILLVDTAYK